jgi:hypothetical protein
VICAGYWGVTYSAALLTFVMRGWFGKPPIKLPPAMDRRRGKPRRTALALTPTAQRR